MSQELVERVRRQRLDDLQLVSLVADVGDLLEPSAARDTRQSVLAALTALVAAQLEHMTAAREELLGLVHRHNVPEDLLPRVSSGAVRHRQARRLAEFEMTAGLLGSLVHLIVFFISHIWYFLCSTVYSYACGDTDPSVLCLWCSGSRSVSAFVGVSCDCPGLRVAGRAQRLTAGTVCGRYACWPH